MTNTKLEIIGPYTPEHEGPYLFSGEECLVHGTLGTQAFISRPESDRGFIVNTFDLMNAREVPVAREFWIVRYSSGTCCAHTSLGEAIAEKTPGADIIHVREVLPGGGE